MMSFGQFAAQMERASREAPTAIGVALSLTMDSVALEAKGYIGREIPEWRALAPRTVAEKTRLGYTGRLSPTDPLMRSGELRASIQPAVVRDVGVVGSPLKKALWMEMGTAKAPARSSMGLAMSRAKPQAELFFGRAATLLLTTGGPR